MLSNVIKYVSVRSEMFFKVANLGVSRLLPAVTGLVTFPLITRHLAPEEYGQLSLINSIIVLVSVGTISWVNSSIHRYYGECVNQQHDINAWIARCVIPFVLIVSIMVVMLVKQLYSAPGLLYVIAYFVLIAQACFSIITAIANAKLDMKLTMVSETIKSGFYIASIIF